MNKEKPRYKCTLIEDDRRKRGYVECYICKVNNSVNFEKKKLVIVNNNVSI